MTGAGKDNTWCVYSLSIVTLFWLYFLYTVSDLHSILHFLPHPRTDEIQRDLEKPGTSGSTNVSSTRTRILSQECYRYSGLTADNTCCRMVDYRQDNGQNILDCALKMPLNRYSNNSENVEQNGTVKSQVISGNSASSGIYWVMAGVSHLRMPFNQLFWTWDSSRNLYRISTFAEGNWMQIDSEDFYRYGGIHEPTREVKHMDIPLRLTFHWDLLLERLPGMIDEWLQHPHLAPNLLITGGGLHFIINTTELYYSKGAEAAVAVYERVLQNLAPKLAALTKITLVIFKLQDHLLKSHHLLEYSNQNIDLYNSIARRVLNGSGVKLWDSAIPLSDGYGRECQRNPRHTPDRTWVCYDFKHVGYVVIKHYVNMLLNFMCNQFLGLDGEYCQ